MDTRKIREMAREAFERAQKAQEQQMLASEAFIGAHLKETGLNPSQCVMMIQTLNDGQQRMWFERKSEQENMPAVAEIVAEQIFSELRRAQAKFPQWPTDPLHAIAVIGEEFGELTQATLQHCYEPEKSTLEDVRKEAIQTAAMVLRFIMSLPLYEFKAGAQHVNQLVR